MYGRGLFIDFFTCTDRDTGCDWQAVKDKPLLMIVLLNCDSQLIHTDTCKYMHIQHAHQIMSLDAKKYRHTKKIQTKYRHIHANTCTYIHIVTDLFFMYFVCISVKLVYV